MTRSGGPARLGPFVLGGPIAHGGSADVWAAVHLASAVPVAVKVLQDDHARDPRFVQALRDEIRVVAGLAHPGIVAVLDDGEIDSTVAEATEGALVAGSPYVVMELASGGSLDRAPLPGSWAEARTRLLAILDALAHAHARGVVHRDLKPGNVLVFAGLDPEPGLKLSDFGLAVAMGASPGFRTAGTPAFMSPEQFAGDWRSVGPWTDLYALGCVAWFWLVGRPLFQGDRAALARAHTIAPLPAFRPRFDVPAGTVDLLRALLAKPIALRCQRAADAAWLLRGLEARPADEVRAPADPAVMPTLPTTEVRASEVEVLEGTRMPVAAAPADPLAPPPPFPVEPPHDVGSTPAGTAGAGLGLFAYRRAPFTGREPERRRLWTLLEGCAARGEAAVAAIGGPPGVGKSRLAEWTCERAEEAGAAVVLKACADRRGPPADPFVAALAQHLGCDGLDGEALRAQVRSRLAPEAGPDGFAALLDGAHPPSPPQRVRIVLAVLRWLSRGRPVIVWLDDAHLVPDALDLAVGLATAPEGRRPRVLLLLSGGPVEHPWPSGVDRIALGPLAEDDCAALLRALLPLPADLARAVAARAAGLPRFAIDIVANWVAADLLRPGPDGFAPPDGALPPLPDALHSLWQDRLARDLVGPLAGGLPCLELAAVYDADVGPAPWASACAAAGLELPATLARWLRANGLLVGRAGALRLAHGQLRESLERSARDGGRLARWHEACAGWARATGAPPDRVAHHLIGAGRAADALPLLLDGAVFRRAHGQPTRALELLDAWEALADGLGLPEGDEARGDCEGARAELLALRERHDLAGARALALVDRATERGWSRTRARALRIAGFTGLHSGRPVEAATWLARARDAFEEERDVEGVSTCLAGLGHAARLQGDFAAAEVNYRAALALRDRLLEGDGAGLGIREALFGLGLALAKLSHADAVPVLQEALALAERHGVLQSASLVHSALAEIARARGDRATALEHYRRAVDAAVALGRDAVVQRGNVALMLVVCERYGEAGPLLEGLLQGTPGLPRTMEPYLLVGLVACDAAAARWARYDERLALLLERTAASGIRDPELAELLHLAGRLAAGQGHLRRAHQVLAVSLEQFRELGLADRAEAVRRTMLG